MASLLVIFGVHSFVDWTWFIPGVAIPALLAGGWLAARGPLELPARAPERLLARIRGGLRSTPRLIAAICVAALAVTAAWAALQPQRSVDAGNDALAALDSGDIAKARRLAEVARERNPLSVEPHLELAAIETRAKNDRAALAALQRAVRLQPANPTTWSHLAEFQLHTLGQPAAAKLTLSAALFLDPRSFEAIAMLVEANRQIAAKQRQRTSKRSNSP